VALPHSSKSVDNERATSVVNNKRAARSARAGAAPLSEQPARSSPPAPHRPSVRVTASIALTILLNVKLPLRLFGLDGQLQLVEQIAVMAHRVVADLRSVGGGEAET